MHFIYILNVYDVLFTAVCLCCRWVMVSLQSCVCSLASALMWQVEREVWICTDGLSVCSLDGLHVKNENLTYRTVSCLHFPVFHTHFPDCWTLHAYFPVLIAPSSGVIMTVQLSKALSSDKKLKKWTFLHVFVSSLQRLCPGGVSLTSMWWFPALSFQCWDGDFIKRESQTSSNRRRAGTLCPTAGLFTQRRRGVCYAVVIV